MGDGTTRVQTGRLAGVPIVIAGLTACQVGRVRFVTHGNCCHKSSVPPPTVCTVPPG